MSEDVVAVRPSARRPPGFRLSPTLDELWIVVAVVLVAVVALLQAIQPYDFWWHIGTGRLIAAEHAIPQVDRFSYTQFGRPFYNQSWLAQVGLYAVHRAGGPQLTLLVKSLVVALAYALVLALTVRRCGGRRLAALVLILATLPVSFANWGARPQTLAYPVFAAFLYILTDFRLSRGGHRDVGEREAAARVGSPPAGGRWRGLWLLPPLMALWVNLHGSFVLGVGLVAATIVGEALKRRLGQRPALSWADWRRLLLVGVVTSAAILANPGGLGVVGYVRGLLANPVVRQLITEWASPSPADEVGLLFFLFVLAGFLVLVYARRPPDLTDLLMFLGLLWLALGAIRHIVWFAMVATPLLAAQAATLLRPPAGRDPGAPLLNLAVVGLLLAVWVLALPWVRPAVLPPPLADLVSPVTPQGAVVALRGASPRPRRLLHTLAFGSYLIWAAPEQPVFIDPRIELYPQEQLLDYRALSGGYGVAELFGKYRFDAALVGKDDQDELVAALRADAGWEQAYEDDAVALFLPR